MQEVQICGRVVRINGFNDKFITFGRDGKDYQLYILYVNWDDKKISLAFAASDNYGGYNDLTLCENSGSTFITLGKRLFSSTNGTSVSKWNISSPVIISYSDNYMYYAGKIYSIPVSSNWNTINNNKTEIGSINCTNNQITFDKDNKHIYSVYNNSLYIYKIEGNTVVQEDVISLDNISIKYMLNTPFCVVSNETSTHYIYLSSENIITSIERDGYRYVSIDVKNIPKSSEVLKGKSYVGIDGINKFGTMPNNGELTYTPTDEEQIIPEGYTSGGKVSAIDITTLDEYKECLLLSANILSGSLPYEKLEYIESTGTQYISTEITMNKTDSVKMILDINISNDGYCGVNGYLQFQMPSEYRNTRCTVKVEYNGSTNDETVYMNDILELTKNWSSFNANYSLIGLFNLGMENNSWSTDSSQIQIGILYGCKLYKNDKLIRDFIPVKKKSDNTICLFDLVTNTFFTNEGTGDFIGGEIVNE